MSSRPSPSGFDPNRPYPPDPYSQLPTVPRFSLVSPLFGDGQPIPLIASGDGDNLSPELEWSGFPPNTKSFAVSCFDPDAPRPGGFWHWLVAPLPPTTTSLTPGAAGLPTFTNDAGVARYYGPQPPEGDHPHRYFFAVHALDVPAISLDPNATCAENAAKLVPHTIARAVLVGTYQR